MTRDGKPDDRRDPRHGSPPRAHKRRPPGLLAAGGGVRFLEWARALGERHGRVAERYGLLDLVLVRRPPPVLLLRRQQLVTSRRFEPRVSLTVQPLLLLRQTVTREQPFAPPDATRAERSASPPSAAQRPSPAPSAGPPVLLQLRSVVERLIGGRGAASLRVAESTRGAGKEPRALTERGAPAATPLQMVFRRAHEADQLTHRGGRATFAETGTEMLLQRVVRQAQRVEERSDGLARLVTRQPATAPQVVEQRAAEFHAPPVAGAAPWGGAATPGTIEQITDQVMRQLDRRVVAARERAGRF